MASLGHLRRQQSSPSRRRHSPLIRVSGMELSALTRGEHWVFVDRLERLVVAVQRQGASKHAFRWIPLGSLSQMAMFVPIILQRYGLKCCTMAMLVPATAASQLSFRPTGNISRAMRAISLLQRRVGERLPMVKRPMALFFSW